MTRGGAHPGTRRTRGVGHRTLVRTRGVEPTHPPLELLDRDIIVGPDGWVSGFESRIFLRMVSMPSQPALRHPPPQPPPITECPDGRHPGELRGNARLGTQGTQVEGDKRRFQKVHR